MRLLLDTHVAIWAVSNPGKIPRNILRMIEREDDVFVSLASVWEISIKNRGGRNRSFTLTAEDAVNAFGATDFELLSISVQHAIAAGTVTPTHGDPFDRMILAQAVTEHLRLITHDAKLADYDTSIITW